MASTNIQTFPGKVGVSNTNPIHTLDIGSNVYIEDTADTKFRVYGNIHASGITVDGSITVIETDNLSVKDPVLLLAAGSTGTSDTGIIMKRSDGDSNVAIFYDEGVGLKLGHTMSSGDDIHLSVDTANALATSVYGPVNVVNSGTQALSVDGGAQVDGNFQVGVVSNLFVDTATSNVGIGTTSPAYKLEVDGKVGIQDELKVAYDTDETSYFGRAAVGYMGQSDQASFSHLDKNTSANFALKQAASGATHLNTPTGQHIRFSVNASEVGRFTGGGDFEVGTSASTKKLIVDTSASEVQMYSQATGSTAGPDLVLMRNNPNNGANNEYIGQIRYEGLNDNGNSLLYAKTTGKIKTATNGSEDGVIETMIKTGGSNRISVRHSGAKFLIQKGTDLQVGEVANLYVDTSTSRVGVNTSSPAYTLDVHGTANVGALMATLTYSNAASNIVTWNSSTNEIIDSGLEKGFTEHPVVPIIFDEETYDSSNPVENVGRIWSQYAEGHGTYEITASTYYVNNGQQIRPPWRLFNYQPTDSSYWQQTYGIDGQGVAYNASSPYEYTGSTQNPIMTTTDVGGTRYLGHWVQIKVPNSVTLAHADIYRTPESQFSGASNRAPGAGVFLGSNDGVAWYKLTEFSGASYASDDKERIAVNATTPYQYYRFVITNIVGGNSATVVNFNEWRLFAEKPVTRVENVHISGQLSSETLQTGYIKWPRKSLKANESEGYVASASNVYNTSVTTAPYTAFNNYREVKSNGYADAFVGGNGDFTAGVANKSRTTGGDTFNHEWLQIQMPRAIKLSHFTLLQRVKNVDNDNDMPKNGRMYGSNDGVSWTKLVTFSNLTYERYEETRVDVKSTTPYSYYRLAVTETVGSSQVYVAVGELQLFEAATGVGAAPTSAKLQVAGSLGMAKGSEFFAGDDVVMELPKHDRPLVKYPEVVLTASAENVSGYEGYTVQYSGRYDSSFSAWTLFGEEFTGSNDEATSGAWVESPNTTYAKEAADAYNGVVGSVLTTVQNAETLRLASNTPIGAWISLELPNSIKLAHIDMRPRLQHASETNLNNVALQAYPRDFGIWGYNGGVWVLLKTVTNHKHTGTAFTYDRISVDSGVVYNKYAIVITRTNAVGGSNANDRNFAAIGQLYFYGYEEGDTSVDVVHRSIPNKPGQQQLAVYWDANDSNSYSFADSSNVYDLSGSGVTGAITGTNGFDAEYNAWVFDGTSDIRSTVNTFSGDQPHTMSVWVYISNALTTADGYISILAPNTGETIDEVSSIRFQNDGFNMQSWGNDIRMYNLGIQKERWYHLTAVYDGGGVTTASKRLYINSVQEIRISTDATSGNTINFTNTTLSLGSRVDGTGSHLKGSIANFRLFSKALNADQVRELYDYDAPRFGHRTNVVALHKGNLGVGVTAPTSRFEVAGTETLQEYPPRAMTGFDTYMEGHGVFRANWANWYSGNTPWGMYTKTPNSNSQTTIWYGPYQANNGYSGGNVYSGTDFAASTTSGLFLDDVNGTRYYGAWTTITMPYDIILKRIHLYQAGTSDAINARCTPEDGVILGSHNGSDWYHVHTFTGLTYGGSVGTSSYSAAGESVVVNAIHSYKHYALITTRTLHYAFTVIIGELYWYGTPAPSGLEDGHLTLGKALTAPRFTGHAAGAETPRAESLVVHYDTTVDSVASGTTVVDISGQGNNQFIQNGLAYSSSSRALDFAATNARAYNANGPNSAGSWVHSVSLWFKVYQSQGTLFFIGEKTTSKAVGLGFQGNNRVRYFFWGNDTDSPTNAFSFNTWTHVVATYDGGTTKSLYINGEKVTTTNAQTQAALSLATANDDFLLGAQLNGTDPFKGLMSNFKIWGGVALTAEEVAAEYALGRTGKALNITDTAVCLGGTVPRAQLDVRGSARFDGHLNVSSGNNNGSPVSILNGWKTLTWSGTLVANGTTTIVIFDRSGRGSSNGGEIAGEVTVVVHRNGVNQTRAYSKYHVNYAHWYGTTFYGENNEYSNYNNLGISNIQVSTNGGAGTVSVSISCNTGTVGQYYIKFDGPIYIP